MWKLNTLLSLLSVLVASLLQPSNATTRRHLVGGYGPIPDLDDPMVANAAKFALLELFAMDEKYSDTPPYAFMAPLKGDQQAFVPQVVRGSEQVVAGLNLKLTMMVLEVDPASGESVCQGAMEVQVYLALDQSMEVTEWGDELTCDQAQVLFEDRSMDEQNEGN